MIEHFTSFLSHPLTQYCLRGKETRVRQEHTEWITIIKNWAVQQLFTNFKKANDSVRRVVLYHYSHWVLYPYEISKVTKNVSKWNLWYSLGRQTFVWHVPDENVSK